MPPNKRLQLALQPFMLGPLFRGESQIVGRGHHELESFVQLPPRSSGAQLKRITVRPTGSQPVAADLTRTPAETSAPTNALQPGREP